jgi:hypothetical protein
VGRTETALGAFYRRLSGVPPAVVGTPDWSLRGQGRG